MANSKMPDKKPLIYITVSIIFVVLIMNIFGIGKVFDFKLLDQMFKLRGPQKMSGNVKVVAIGDESVSPQVLGRWPWRRAYMATFINIMNILELDTLVFDVLFTEPSSNFPEDDEALIQQADLMGNVYFPFFGMPKTAKIKKGYSDKLSPEHEELLEKIALARVEDLKNTQDLFEFKSLSLPIPELSEVAGGSGYINAEPDTDGITRRVPLVMRYKDYIVPNVAFGAVLNYMDIEKEDVTITPGRSIELKTKNKTIRIPVDDKTRMLVNHVGKFNADNIGMASFVEVVQSYNALADGEEPKIDLSNLEDKMAFLGLTATGTSDLNPVPYSTSFPMVAFLATVASNVVDGNFLRPVSVWVNSGIIVFVILLAMGITAKFKALSSALLNIIIGTGYFYTSYILFKNECVVSTLYPLVGILFSYTSMTVYKFATEEQEKKIIRSMFQRYVSTQVVDVLLEKPDQIKLGGQRKLLTVFFSDIRGFTSMSEKLQPEEVVHVLNEYLTEMIEIVFKYNGTLDKFMGDAVMALWGAPVKQDNHAHLAVKAAWEMKGALKKLQEKWVAEGKKTISVGMGINTGDVVVGNMGSKQFADYTVIGDNVNLAARLEENAKPGQLLLSESTYRRVKDIVKANKMSPMKVKGKDKPVEVYEVIELIKENI
ncbi:MAG: CHASE2 domain-containing protein [Elusimicrobiota bacterium]